MMRKFTFIANYKGGTYISQCCATNILEALFLWYDSIFSKLSYLDKREMAALKEEIEDEDTYPVPLNDVENVWCGAYSISNKSNLFLLNIVETVSSEP